MAAHPPPGAFSSPGAVPATAVPATDPVINQTTDKDPIVIHEDHHEPAPIPAQAAEDAPIHQNPAAAALAAQPPKGKQEDVPVVSYEENDPRDTTTSAMYRAPGPPHSPIDAGVVNTTNPPGDDGVQLVEGIDNRDLYALVRRFNTQINRVLSPAEHLPPKEPDLRMSNLPNIPYRSDTLKSNFERVAATVGPSTKRGLRELQRLRDWHNETSRTAKYCVAYFVSWFFGYTLLAVCVFFTVLMCFPDTRRLLFPEVSGDEIKPPPGKPNSATDPTNQKGDESLIAPKNPNQQRTKGEQAEEQGFETRAMIEAYAQAIIVGGTHKKGDPKKQPPEEDNLVHDEKGNVIGKHVDGDDPVAEAQGTAVKVGGENVVAKPGKEKEATNQAVKKKRDQTIEKMAKATETSLGAIADTVEILYNSVSPPIPYPDSHSRFKLAAVFVLLPGLILTFIPAALFGRVLTFLIGEMFWGWPINVRVIRFFMRMVPNWRELLDLRNSILSGCPTNAQLTLHLLRVSEDLKTPLPPPPENKDIKSAKKTLKDTSPANPSGAAVAAEKREIEESNNPAEKTKAKTKHHLSNAFKKISKKLAGVHGDVAVDGNTKPINNKFEGKLIDKKFGKESPDAYGCKLDGKGGHLIIDEDSGRLGWVRVRDQTAEGVWDIASIVELRKDNVAVPRLALGLLGGAEVDSLGLTIRFAGDADEYHFQSLERREQLFNRLIALGPQRWEIL